MKLLRHWYRILLGKTYNTSWYFCISYEGIHQKLDEFHELAVKYNFVKRKIWSWTTLHKIPHQIMLIMNNSCEESMPYSKINEALKP